MNEPGENTHHNDEIILRIEIVEISKDVIASLRIDIDWHQGSQGFMRVRIICGR